MQRQYKKHKVSTVIRSLWKEHRVERVLIVGTIVKWFSGLAKGERQLESYGSSERKHSVSYEKSGITMVRRPC